MTMLKGEWVSRGYFHVGSGSEKSVTQAIRDELSARLGLTPPGLQIRSYPVGPAFRHTFFWREGQRDYAEAQFFARIAEDHPVLSLGMTVEKGLEDLHGVPRSKRASYSMHRATWDWSRLVTSTTLLLGDDARQCAAEVQRPLIVRIKAKRLFPRTEVKRMSRTFALVDGTWFERYVGRVEPREMATYIASVDRKREWWGNLYMSVDFGPAEIDGMPATRVAEILMAFDPARRRLRRPT
jgi:hypothetical protein